MNPGWRLPGYAELLELGAGAQGRVVLAADEDSGERVAIKYLAADLLTSPHHLETFGTEATLLQRVADPHVARLHSFIRASEGAAIVMEAIEGVSLRAVLDERDGAPLGAEEALATLKGSLLGMAAAHDVGVVHRDYKPANVMVQPDGSSKLIDFGIAVLQGQRSTAGTPAYMSPEQWRGDPASAATDVYAATCVFYECVTGHRPFRGADIGTLRTEHTRLPVPVAGVPEPLRTLVLHGMAKDPAERPTEANEFIAELEDIAVETYGRDWERVGLIGLGGAIGGLISGVSGAALMSATVTHTGAMAQASGGTALGQSAHMAGRKGALAKVGGTKGATGIAGGLAVAGVAAVVVLNHHSDPPALRLSEARQVLATFQATANQAYAGLDDRLLGQVEAEPLLGVEQGSVTWARRYGTGLTWSWHVRDPALWIPRIHGQRQRWFAVEAGPTSDKDDRGIVLVFAKVQAGWRAAIASFPTEQNRYPKVMLDKKGYATEVRTDDRHYLMKPGELSARLATAQNAAAANGGTSSGDRSFADGPCTSGFGKVIASEIRRSAANGWTNTIPSAAAPRPMYALKAAGGAVVWITQRRTNTMVNSTGSLRRYYYPDFPGAAKVASVRYRHSLVEGIVSQSAVFVPRGSSGQARVVNCNDWLHDFAGT